MKTILTIVFALSLSASAFADVLTFDNLGFPPIGMNSTWRIGGISQYEGFSLTSSNNESSFNGAFNGVWGRYTVRFDADNYGFDDGLASGMGAIFTPWGCGINDNYGISRDEGFIFDGAFICQANLGDDNFSFDGGNTTSLLEVRGWMNGVEVYSFSTFINYEVGQFYSFGNEIAVDKVTFSTNTGAAITIDDFTYRAIPVPPAAAVLGLAGLLGRRRR